MGSRFAARRFAACIRTKRGERSLRETAMDIGAVSPSTLLRLEREEVPNIETFLHVCEWLRIAPGEFIQADEAERMNTLS
jgi:transcriptional regulator with XRE-family HTH domain